MLRKLMFICFIALILVFAASCSRTPSPADAKRMLAGRWELKLGHDCQDYGIRSDELILHSDGRLEQHFVSVYNQRYDADGERWSYMPDNSVNFDDRKNFFTNQPKNGVIGVSIHETLLVEFGNPSVILLDPHSDCLYRKVASE